jgi:hypothetical protein
VPSEVDVVNRALISLGALRITSLDQEGKSATSAKAIYAQVRDDVMRSHPWNSCKARTTLAALAGAPAFGWALQYELPADCLRVLAVNGDWWPTEGWELEGRALLTNETSPIELEYVRREEDPNQWDAELVTAVAARLAYELAPALASIGSVVDRAEKRADIALAKGKITDGLEQESVEDDLEDSWLSVRF